MPTTFLEVEHVCVRCSKRFIIRSDYQYPTKEECSYHFGRLWTKRDGGSTSKAFSCCQGPPEASGCQIAKCHVTNGGIQGNLRVGFVSTKAPKEGRDDYLSGIFALDCEMVSRKIGCPVVVMIP
eukprot:m.103784 g.103784  ORF g.103784 m.103784 type:complete len:124 (+) comp37192_c0_seq15:1229-1600(+)